MWTFAGVFDGTLLIYEFISEHYDIDFKLGHAGHDTADHTVKCFPPFLKAQLGTTLSSNSPQTGDTKMISNLISDSIRTFDENLTKDLLDLFPGGEKHAAIIGHTTRGYRNRPTQRHLFER